MAKPQKIPDRCKPCVHLWENGVKDGKHDRWCCEHGRPAPKAEPHCRVVGGFHARSLWPAVTK
jgi:hypothetical protein